MKSFKQLRPIFSITSFPKTLHQKFQRSTVANVEESCPAKHPYQYNEYFSAQLDKRKHNNTYRVFRQVNKLSNSFPFANEYSTGIERKIVIWCSNDYLGLSCHPEVKRIAMETLESLGAGAGGPRNISGNSLYHAALEHELAALHSKEAGLVFTSGYVANEATLFTLARNVPGCHIFSDSGNHASLIHGIKTSGAPVHIYKSNSASALSSALGNLPKETPKIVVFESVHSMSGEICPLKDILLVAKDHGALTFVDEVHAIGLYGKNGGGVAEQEEMLDYVDVISGTLGKSLGSMGGYIVGKRELVDFVRSVASGFIFTTSLPPCIAAAALMGVKLIRSEEGQRLRAEQRRLTGLLRDCLKNAGIKLRDDDKNAPYIPVYVGDSGRCSLIADEMLKAGHYIQSVNYPTVPMGTERFRVTITPNHSPDLIHDFVNKFRDIWKASL